MGRLVYVPAHRGRRLTWTPGFILRLVLASLSFLLLTYNAVVTLAKAIRHSGYYYSFHDPNSWGYFSAPPPSLGDAGWAFLLGPGAQLALLALISLTLWRRRPSWIQRLHAATWWLLGLDALAALVIYDAAASTLI